MRFSYYRRPLFILLALYAGCLAIFGGRLLRYREALPFPLPRSGVPVEGRVSQYPAAGQGGLRFTLDNVKLYGRPAGAGLMVYSPDAGGASYGDRISFLADLAEPAGASVPGSLDWAEYLSRRGIAAQARARDIEITGRANPFIRLARGLRTEALSAFSAGLKPEEAAVLAGIALGEKKSVPQDIREAFQDSGAMHLLVASGTHVGFVVALVYFICARLGLRRRGAGLAALGVTGLYVVAAGLGLSLLRAYIMFSAGLAAWLLRRESGAFHALTAACLLILLFSPGALFDAGFQMSFLAAYGLVAGFSVWKKHIKAPGPRGAVQALFFTSFFAQLFMYPLLAVYFHKISVISLVSNMALVPAAGVVMTLGFAMAASYRAGLLFKLTSLMTGVFMRLFIMALKFFGGLPFAAVKMAEPSGLFVGGFFILAFAALHAPLFGFRSKGLYASLCLGLLLMAAGPVRRVCAYGDGGWRALLFGDADTFCSLVSDPGGRLFLVNPGLSGKKLSEAVFSSGARSLEAVMLTSVENKNYSGLAELAELVRIKSVLVPYGPRAAGFDLLLSRLEKSGSVVRRMWPGDAVPDVSCGWDGYSPGYSGAGDRFLWTIGGIRVSRDGEYAEGAHGGAEAVRGAIVSIAGGEGQ